MKRYSTLRQQIAIVDKRLQNTSFQTWKAVLKLVCSAHAGHLDGARLILDELLVRRLDDSKTLVKNLMTIADCLSAQLHADATTHFVANQISLLVRKYPFPKLVNPFEPEEAALENFIESERRCLRQNRLFMLRSRPMSGRPLRYASQYESMRSFIQYVIGCEVPLTAIMSRCGFGPGASMGVSGDATSPSRKLLQRGGWSVSPGAYTYCHMAVATHAQFREILNWDSWSELPAMDDDRANAARHAWLAQDTRPGDTWEAYKSKTEVVTYNKIAFVPKTAKIHRSIAVEPLLNGFIQKGVDMVMRDSLRRIGIDLSDQEPNAEMAREGSLDADDGWCTIDLRDASNSISTGLVRAICPPAWFEFLNSIRSRNWSYRSYKNVKYEKFCSMGNGFCFPLETLIFVAACHAVGAGRPGIDFRVYGDDIIVRKQFFGPVVRLLRHMGFRTNTEKTFSTGPFRESCGADWFGGEDVRPYTFDTPLDSVENVFKWLNLTRRNARTTSFFEPARDFVLRLLPERLRFYRPYKGPANTAIDATGEEYMSASSCSFKSGYLKTPICSQTVGIGWEWLELSFTPVTDNWHRRWGAVGDVALLYGALSGSASVAPFTYRRKTVASVCLTAHSGAVSQWLPSPSDQVIRWGVRPRPSGVLLG